MPKIKLSLFILLAVCLILALTACGNAYEEDTFFSEEKLEKAGIPDLPIPEGLDLLLENNKILYLELGDATDYITAIGNYLLSLDFAYIGTQGDKIDSFAGFMNIYAFFPCETLADFKATPFDSATYRFVFSNDEPSGHILNAYVLSIDCGERELFKYDDGDFIYDTRILLYESDVTEAYSTESSSRTFDILYDDFTYFAKDSSYPFAAPVGTEITLRTVALSDADLEVKLNGKKLPKTYWSQEYWEYTFVMPNEEVMITFKTVPIGQEVPDTVYLFYAEPWLRKISKDDIASISFSLTSGMASDPVTSTREITELQKIEQTLAFYQDLTMEPVVEKPTFTDIQTLTVSFILHDMTCYSLSFDHTYYQIGTTHHLLEAVTPE